jgi:GTP 3',8-cyclase
MNSVSDQLGRSLTDLRVSVTDRCNFRCRYCMPREHFDHEHRYLPRTEILSFEEISRVVAALVPLGLRKVRLTGGEPLLRNELHKLVALLKRDGELEVALTSNGSLLAKHARALRDAGLDRITVSLDSLSPEVFARMTDSDVPVAEVLAGIETARTVGFGPVKINAVVRRGVNDHTIVELARYFKGSGDIVRFIEYMDVGLTNGWRMDHVLSGQRGNRRDYQRYRAFLWQLWAPALERRWPDFWLFVRALRDRSPRALASLHGRQRADRDSARLLASA